MAHLDISNYYQTLLLQLHFPTILTAALNSSRVDGNVALKIAQQPSSLLLYVVPKANPAANHFCRRTLPSVGHLRRRPGLPYTEGSPLVILGPAPPLEVAGATRCGRP
jgi:hypothetical protein